MAITTTKHRLGLCQKTCPPRPVIGNTLSNLLKVWRDKNWLMSGIKFEEVRNDITVYTDASHQGWGAHMNMLHLPKMVDHCLSGRWSPEESELHINLLEMLAVQKALVKWQFWLKNKNILIASDNTTVVAYINNQGGTRSYSLLRLVTLMLEWCQTNKIVVKARHIAGHLNVIADRLSRPDQVLRTEWRLNIKVFQLLISIWDFPKVDMFATWENAQLPQFVSPLPNPKAWAVDALSMNWDNLQMYAFPPFPLILKILKKLRSSYRAKMLLIAPLWPTQPWFPQLLQMLVTVPRSLPFRPDLLTQAEVSNAGRQFHRMESVIKFHRDAGFSQKAAEYAAASRRTSTVRTYQSQWKIFTNWASERGHDPFCPSVPQIAEFMIYLFETRSLTPRSIKGYASALLSVLKPMGLGDRVSNQVIHSMFKTMSMKRPCIATTIPKWDINVVLKFLSGKPYEPLREAPIKELTYKTVFYWP